MTTMNITVSSAAGHSFQDVCQALAEGDHELGDDATHAGYMVGMAWAGPECPWFLPAPSAGTLEIEPFDGFDLVTE